VLAGPLRRDIGETIQAALLYADLRGFTALSESNPPAAVISALDAWFDRIAGPVHAFGGEVLKFIGDGMLAIFPVVGGSPRGACDAALRAVAAARTGMAHLDEARRQQGLLAFLAELRLELARRKLRATMLPVAAIGDEVGYRSESAFSRAFYRRFGMRPGEARAGVFRPRRC